MAVRTLLGKLEQRGLVVLPPRRGLSPNRHRLTAPPLRSWDTRRIEGSLRELGALQIREVSTQSSERAQLRSALATFHYLGYRSPVGETLQYGVYDAQGRLLSALIFGAAAWKCAARDRWIRWSPEQRERGLGLLANNSRFLILPWVKVPRLASWILSRIARRIDGDWQAKYGHRILALETFVETGRFTGTCYQAANWIHVGATTGRSRQDRTRTVQVPVKEVYLYPLSPKSREGLCR